MDDDKLIFVRNRLADIRGQRGGWQGIAARCGLSYFTVARIAAGNNTPRADTLQALYNDLTLTSDCADPPPAQ